MHDLRDSYASVLIPTQQAIMDISKYLENADVAITKRVYAHFLELKKQDTMSISKG